METNNKNIDPVYKKGRINAGIIGGAGYTGGEMLRILLNHPDVDIVFVHSGSNAGNYVYEVHTDLFGDTDLKFAAEISHNIDVLFLCVGHGDAKTFLETNEIPAHIKIIDLSQDFRLKRGQRSEVRDQRSEIRSQRSEIGGQRLEVSQITSDFGLPTSDFVYGLPELNRDAIKEANNIANPGCFATCLQLGLLPLAANNLLNNEVHITATTGSTGAGQSLSATTHFTWRNDNLSVYKAFGHQHLNEIGQSLIQLQPGFDKSLNFIPYRGDFTRGIIASIYTDSELSEAEALKVYQQYYEPHAFTHVTSRNIDLKQVVNTNKCFLQVQKHGNKLLIISIIDNLVKGASGQAVQNMNLMFGLDETAGLRLKATGF